MIFGILFAGMCLVRVLSVSAEEDIEEIYANEHRGSAAYDDEDTSERDEIFESQRAEIRLSRPAEAASRIAVDEEQPLVPGVQELWAREQQTNPNQAVAKLTVPNKNGPGIGRHVEASRGLASLPPNSDGNREASPDYSARDTERHQNEVYSSHQGNSATPLASSAMEPRGLALNVQSIPIDHRAEQPLPDVVNRGGVQEVSVIVSDYGFFPNRVPVIAGVPVKIFLATTTKQTSCFMLDEFGVKKGISPGKVDEVVFVPTGTGRVRFYCPMKSIEGWLVVKEAPSDANRGLAASAISTAELEPIDQPQYNTPKNAGRLRALIED